MKSVVLLVLFITAAVFLTRPERNSDYRQEKLDVYLGSTEAHDLNSPVAKSISAPSISVTRANVEGDFEITFKKLGERTEVPRHFKKYLNRNMTFKVPNPICNFLEGPKRLMSCSLKDQELSKGAIAETFSSQVRVRLLALSSGVLSGQYPDEQGVLQEGEFYVVRVSLQVGATRVPLDFQFLTSPKNVIFKSVKKQLLVAK